MNERIHGEEKNEEKTRTNAHKRKVEMMRAGGRTDERTDGWVVARRDENFDEDDE